MRSQPDGSNINGPNTVCKIELFPVSSWPCLVSVANRFNPGGSDSKESICNAGDRGLIPGSGRSPGEGNGNPLQYSCLENSMDKETGGLQSMGSQKVQHE